MTSVLVLCSTAVVFALANLAASLYLARNGSAPGSHEALRQAGEAVLAKYGIAYFRNIYRNKSDEQIRQLVRDQSELRSAYEPFAEFRSTAVTMATLNIHEAGFRLVGADQGPWPLNPAAINIFVFGGSTTIGSGVSDHEAIPAVLQELLRERVGRDAGQAAINVYNFGVGAHFSSQEITYFQNQLRYGNVPDIVVFVDGLNDFHYWNGEPATAQTTRNNYNTVLAMSRALGREQGVAWHLAELWDSLPLVRLAKDASSAMAGRSAAAADLDGPPVDKATGTAAPDLAAADPAAMDAANDRVYAATYSDGIGITSGDRIQAVISRYLVNKKIAQGIADQFGIEAVFAWQPIPLYQYDLSLHRFPIPDEHRRSRYGYPEMARYVASHDMGAGFAWCASIMRNANRPLYLDQVHYTAEGDRMVAACIADTIRASGALDRALLRKRAGNNVPVASNSNGPDAAGKDVHRLAALFGPQAVTAELEASKPLAEWGQTSEGGVLLVDASANFASVSEDFPLDPSETGQMHSASVTVRADTSDYLGLVLMCLGGAKPQDYVLFVNPQTTGTIAAHGFYEIRQLSGRWVRYTLAGACTEPGASKLRVILSPAHGDPAARGTIVFGGGELALMGSAEPTVGADRP